ncbi:helix-turn-helix domain-containing protein [Nocardia wallacei]|uniref:helix-turn-helix domain-containing protein n=1 Tax=Nocardia wallacei TaxID=480035 RepID=UPI0024571D8A|nr:helix-turn-helix domain-containing protein [Nocardia wallacei]
MQTLAELLVDVRSAAGLDQRDVAGRVGVSRQTVDRWERGEIVRPRREHLCAVAEVLGIEVDPLLSAAGYPAILDPDADRGVAVRPLSSSLPFHTLTADRFEDVCCELLNHRHPGGHASRYGASGEEQDGIDLLLTLDGKRYATGQCKRVEQFGPAKVREAVKLVKSPGLRNYLFLAREVATADARDEMGRYDTWSLWDGQDMSRYVRFGMSTDEAARFIDAHFPGHREPFLRIAEPSPWQTIEEFYTPVAQGLAFTHDWTLVGRDDELATVVAAVRGDPQPVSVVLGQGGIGKTRLLRSIAEELERQDWFVRLLPKDATPDGKAFERIPATGATVVIIDDAHDRADCGGIVKKLIARNRSARVVIAARPYGRDQLARSLRDAGLVFDELTTVPLKDLELADAETLAVEALGPEMGSYAGSLAALTSDSPLATTMGGRLIRSGQLTLAGLGQHESIRRDIMHGFKEALLAASAHGDPEIRGSVVDAISVLQPFRSDDDVFRAAISNLVGIGYPRISHHLRSLEDAGILIQRNGWIRIVPDLLGDVILADACFDRATGDHNGYLDDVLRAAGDDARVNAFVNVARLDWQLGYGLHEATVSWWSFVESELQHRNLSAYLSVLRLLEKVAWFQSDRAIAVVRTILDNPVPDEEAEGIARHFRHTWRKVVEETTAVLRAAAHRDSSVRAACELLWGLAHDESSEPNKSRTNSALQALREIAEFSVGKSPEFSQAVLELAESKAQEVTGRSPLPPIEPLVATEIMSSELSRATLTMRAYRIDEESIRPIRRAAIALALRELRNADVKRAVAGAGFVGLALRLPGGLLGREVGDDERDSWTADFLRTLSAVHETIATPGAIDPVVHVGLRDALHWTAHYAPDTLRVAARVAIEDIPDSLETHFALLVHQGWAHLVREPGVAYEEYRRTTDERIEQVVTRAIRELDDYAITLLLDERAQREVQAFDRASLHRNRFVEALVSAQPTLLSPLLERLTEHPSSGLATLTTTILSLVGDHSPDELVPTTRHLLNSTNPRTRTEAAKGLATRSRAKHSLVPGELAILHNLTTDAEEDIRVALVEAARQLALTGQPQAHDLLAAIEFANSTKVAQEVLMYFDIDDALTWSDLTPTQQAKIRTQLRTVDDIDQYSILEFLRRRSSEEPAAVLNLLRGRIEYAETPDAPTAFRPVPTSWAQPLAIRDHPDYRTLLRDLLAWLAQGTTSQRKHFGAPLFIAAAGGFDDPTRQIVLDALRTSPATDVDAITAVLADAPNDLVLTQPEFVADVLTASMRFDAETQQRIETALATSAITGIRHGTPGQPYPEDVRLRDEGAAIAAAQRHTPRAAEFYSRLSEHGARAAERDSRDQTDDD